MNTDPIKSQIMALTAPVPAKRLKMVQNIKETTAAKIEAIRNIIFENHDWKLDAEVFGRILKFTEGGNDSNVWKFRRDLMFKQCCIEKDGIMCLKQVDGVTFGEINSMITMCLSTRGVLFEKILTLPEKILKDLNKQKVWSLVEEQEIKILVVKKEKGEAVVYEDRTLALLAEKGPELRDLVEEYALQFDTGEVINQMSKAKLSLCGPFFEGIFKSGMKETTNKIISLKEVSLNGFLGILDCVEIGKLDSGMDVNEYKTTADKLLFSIQSTEVPPEKVYGQVDWEKYFGNVGNVPPLPKEAFEPCPIHNKEKRPGGPRRIDSFTYIYMPPSVDDVALEVDSIEKMAKSDKFGKHKIGFEDINLLIRTHKEVNKKIEKGYWVEFSPFLEETRGKSFSETQKHIEENYPKEFGFPTVREALIYFLMPRARTGACVFEIGKRELLTWCLEKGSQGSPGHMCVGGDADQRLNLILGIGRAPCVSVVLAHRFC